ncbi:MAG: hypothetical protein E2O48_00720 [Gemmatimonadetes bacterium]|nr:MAG: hypothetical protein E2O48_00720 [Gemmatimonadota bacterium]
MAATRRLSSLARKARARAGLRVRQPLAEMRVAVPHSVSGSDFDACLELLKQEVNVKTVSIVRSDTELVSLEGKPNFRTLGKVYGADTPAAAAAARELTAAQLQQLEAGDAVTVEFRGRQFGFRPVDVVIERRVATDWLVESDGPFVAALNPMISEDLRREGLARELVNRVQRMRRDAGYLYTTRIVLAVSGDDDTLAAARAFDTFIAGETLARRFEVGEELASPDVRQSVDLDGRNAVVTLKRFDGEDGA